MAPLLGSWEGIDGKAEVAVSDQQAIGQSVGQGAQRAAAILLTHGIGEQHPYETIDAFVQGLGRRLKIGSGQLRIGESQESHFRLYEGNNTRSSTLQKECSSSSDTRGFCE